jgi:glycosyltransferase involved in cell wall biosynthesis
MSFRGLPQWVRRRPTQLECDVLHVLWPGDYVGGVQTQVAGYVRAASQHGDMVHRVCFLDGAGPTGDALENEGISFRLGFRRGWGPLGLLRFARALRAVRPRVVHFHWRTFGAIAVARVTLPRTPFVWTEHHPGAITPSLRVRLFYRLFRGRFSRFVVTSDAMATYVEGFGIGRERIPVIPSALTVPLRRPESPMLSRGNVIGVITRLDGPKRIDLFIDVLAELRNRGVACSGVVVGEGPYRETYEEHARRSGPGDVVRFVGMSADVAGWLDRFDVFLSTSSIETFGLAVLEAMARGVPVVAMPCPGGLSDLVGRGGVLVTGREPRIAADAVESLLASPAERARVGRRGYSIATTYTLDAAVSRHAAMYRELTTDAQPLQAPVPG